MNKFTLFLFMMCLFAWTAKAQTTVQIGDLYYGLNETDLTAEVLPIPDETEDHMDNPRYTLAEITIPATVENGEKTYNVVRVGDNALRSNLNLTKVTLPESVKSIGNGAFAGNKNLTLVAGMQFASFIDEWAFHECEKLAFAFLSNDITAIKAHCFQGCASLSGITLPKGVTAIEACAFQNCTSLKTANIPSTVTTIDSWAFMDAAVEEVVIPEGVTSLKAYTFGSEDDVKKNPTLKTIKLPASLLSLEDWTFNRCTNLQAIYVAWPTAPNPDDPEAAIQGIKWWAFGNSIDRTTCTAYVPEQYRDAYGETWFDFPVQTYKSTGIITVKAEEASVNYTNGTLNLFDLVGYTVSVISADGKLAATFKADQASVQLPLASGVYILNATKGQARKITKFIVK